MGSLAESVTKDALIGVCGKKTNYKKRIEKLKELQVIDSSLKKELEWLWDYRNREHLFLVEEWEYGHYELRHSNRAIRAMQALRTGLDKYFRNAGFDS